MLAVLWLTSIHIRKGEGGSDNTSCFVMQMGTLWQTRILFKGGVITQSFNPLNSTWALTKTIKLPWRVWTGCIPCPCLPGTVPYSVECWSVWTSAAYKSRLQLCEHFLKKKKKWKLNVDNQPTLQAFLSSLSEMKERKLGISWTDGITTTAWRIFYLVLQMAVVSKKL